MTSDEDNKPSSGTSTSLTQSKRVLLNTVEEASPKQSMSHASQSLDMGSTNQQNMRRLQLIMMVKQNMQAVGQNPDIIQMKISD